MGPALDYHADGSSDPRSPRPEAHTTANFTDALGERHLEFDLASGMSVERLRFTPEFADSPVFEHAVRDRIERFEYFRHPAIATARAIVRQPTGALVLESKHTAGRRLSEIGLARNTALALDVIRQLTPALVALHEAGDGIVHGLFGPDRVIVTREGRLMLVEHVLGSALVAMRMPSSRMRAEFGLALPDNANVIALDQEDDLTELGLLALSLLIGRRVSPTEYPDQIEALVSESAQTAADLTAEAAWLRRWIERAVHIGPNPFRTAREAVDTIGELGDAGELRTVGRGPAARPGPVLVAGSAAAERFAALQRDLPEDTAMKTHDAPASTSPDFVQTMPIAMATTPTPAPLPTPPKGTARRPMTATTEPRRPTPAHGHAPTAPVKDAAPARPAAAKPRRRWLMPTLISLAVAQAAVIAGLMLVKQSQTPAVDAPAPSPAQTAAQPAATPAVVLTPTTSTTPAPVPAHTPASAQTPISASASAESSAHPTTAAPAPAPSASSSAPSDAPAAGAATGQRFGGVKVNAPFELQVFEGGKLLGVTAGPIALVEGPHSLDLVDDALEFKSHANTTVKPGQITSLAIAVPQGRLSVNAVPWAEVLIDGTDMGQTPLANLPVTIGPHDVVFRHPQLGEQKQSTVVKATTPTRISVTFPK